MSHLRRPGIRPDPPRGRLTLPNIQCDRPVSWWNGSVRPGDLPAGSLERPGKQVDLLEDR